MDSCVEKGKKIRNKNGHFDYPLVGIVSGGIGCGEDIPGWYTKVAIFADWIQCIVEKSRK